MTKIVTIKWSNENFRRTANEKRANQKYINKQTKINIIGSHLKFETCAATSRIRKTGSNLRDTDIESMPRQIERTRIIRRTLKRGRVERNTALVRSGLCLAPAAASATVASAPAKFAVASTSKPLTTAPPINTTAIHDADDH